MKGMSQRLALLLAISLGATTSSLAFNPFGLLGSRDAPSMEGLLASVPADTAFFAGGTTDASAADFFNDWVPGTSEADLEELVNLMGDDVDHPTLNLLLWLLSDYLSNASQGYDTLNPRYGLGPSIDSLFYLDGAVPVIRLTLEDSDALLAVLDQAETESGAQSRTFELEGASIRAWPLTDDTADLSAELAVLVQQNVLTISFLLEGEQPVRHAQRFGLAEMPNALAQAGIWDALGDDYGFNDQMRGYVSFTAIAEALLIPQSNRLGRDLQRLIPEMQQAMDQNLDASCRSEWLALSQQSPRLVFGSDDFETTSTALHQSLRFIWELTHPQVTTSLARLPGSLPAYSQNASDKLFAFAAGLNMDALTPVATDLWTLFTQAEFECAQLVEWQQQAQTLNPAMIGMVSGMAQGVKGIGAALYSLVPDTESPLGVTPSIVVSLSADNPQALAPMLTASVPGLTGISIPTNGDAVALPLPGVPLEVFAAIKGKHLVAFTGPEGAQAVQELADEALNERGISALALNYQRTGQAMLDMLEALPESPTNPLLFADDLGGCDQAYLLALQFAQLPMQLSYSDTFNANGWDGQVDMHIERASPLRPDVNGRFQVASLGPDCAWTTTGQETLNDDGTGQYSEGDAGGQCDLYQLDYQWRQQGLRIIQEPTQERTRNRCSDDWATYEAETDVCHLVGEHDNGFYCLFHFDNEPTLLRYSR
ncbi:MAG: hypothetical protein ACX931_08275 [Saccharospirillum sp.]